MTPSLRSTAFASVCALIAALGVAQDAPPSALTIKPGGFLEIAAEAINAHRTPGGNEDRYGDYVVGLNLDIDHRPKAPGVLRSFALHVTYVPADQVLDYADPQRANHNNHNWLRADGILSQPYLLAHLQAHLGTRHALRIRLGGFLMSGLEPLDGAPNMHYLTMPAPLLHTQHWDKGYDFTYRYCPRGRPALTLGLGVLNGDWAVGEASLARLHNSAANSYPSWAVRAEIRPIELAARGSLEERLGAITLGVDATRGELGSVWLVTDEFREKRRQDNAVGYLGWSKHVDAREIETRIFVTRMERNPLGDGTGRLAPAVKTRGYGAEIAYRKVAIGRAVLDFYGNAWRMTNESGVPDGEIWPTNAGLTTRKIHGWTGGVRWRDPVDIAPRVKTSIGFSYGQILPDVPDAWGSSKTERTVARLVCTVRL